MGRKQVVNVEQLGREVSVEARERKRKKRLKGVKCNKPRLRGRRIKGKERERIDRSERSEQLRQGRGGVGMGGQPSFLLSTTENFRRQHLVYYKSFSQGRKSSQEGPMHI